MKASFVFVVVGGEDCRIVPIDSSILAVTSVFRNTGYILIRFSRCDVGLVLSHPSPKIDASLSNVFRIIVAAACLEINAFLVEFIWTRLIRAAKDISQFRAGF